MSGRLRTRLDRLEREMQRPDACLCVGYDPYRESDPPLLPLCPHRREWPIRVMYDHVDALGTGRHTL
jgi:hypothetical protein